MIHLKKEQDVTFAISFTTKVNKILVIKVIIILTVITSIFQYFMCMFCFCVIAAVLSKVTKMADSDGILTSELGHKHTLNIPASSPFRW